MSGCSFIFLLLCNLVMSMFVLFDMHGAAAAWAGCMVIFMADAICTAIKRGQR